MSKWEKLNPKTSTNLKIIREFIKKGHKVSLLYTYNFTVMENVTSNLVSTIEPMDRIPDNIGAFYKRVNLNERLMQLHAFDCIMIRKDPPMNPFVFNFLDSVKNEVVIVNEVDGVRKANNKLYTTTFHDPNHTYLPITHVSGNKKYINKVIDDCDEEKMILKPLDGSGGRGVIVLEKNARTNINSLLDFYIDDENDNFVILQEYIQGAEEGDVRVIMLNGNAIGSYKRTPAEGEFRANVDVGGSIEKYNLTDSQRRICKMVGKKLVSDGLYFAGLDMIGDKILEINVLNPSGNTNMDKIFKVRVEKQIVSFVEEKVEEMTDKRIELEYLLNRLNKLR